MSVTYRSLGLRIRSPVSQRLLRSGSRHLLRRCPAVKQPCNSALTCEDVQIVVDGAYVTLPSCVR